MAENDPTTNQPLPCCACKGMFHLTDADRLRAHPPRWTSAPRANQTGWQSAPPQSNYARELGEPEPATVKIPLVRYA